MVYSNGIYDQELHEQEPFMMGEQIPEEIMEETYGTIYDPETIVRLVDDLESSRGLLHNRMDRDMDYYHLAPFTGIPDEDGNNILDGYRKFTSNDPATTMNMALHLGANAERVIRVRTPRTPGTGQQDRQMDNAKELFCLGILESADDRRSNLLERNLQDSIISQSLFRGRISIVVLIRRDLMTGQSYPDIIDWDPRNTYWEVGDQGVNWACHKSYQSRTKIIETYGIDPAEALYEPRERDQDKQYAVYDWYDNIMNCVIVEGSMELKKSTPHGMPRCPVIIDLAETRPLFSAGEGNEFDYEAHYGESFYRSAREMFDEQNQVYSIVSVLTGRSIRQPIAVTSRDGSLTLPEDPWLTGQEISLSTDEQQSIVPLEQMEMAREAGPFMGLINSAMQRGTFPSNLFGNLSSPLSGYALTQLRRDVEAPLTPHIRSCERVIKKTLTLLVDAYKTGLFGAMELSGREQGPGKPYFYQKIPPELVATPGSIEVHLLPSLPQDSQAKLSLVQGLREGPNGVPLIDDRFAREIMEFQDPDAIEKAVWEQQSGRGSPLAIAMNSLEAASAEGNQSMKAVWQEETNLTVMQKRLEMMMLMLQTQQLQMAMQQGMPPGEGGAPGPGGPGRSTGPQQPPGQVPARRTTPSPEVQPPEERGVQSAPSQQAGPNVPPGTPRPGAQDQAGRLAAIGLFGPNG